MATGGGCRSEPEARVTAAFEAVGALLARAVGELPGVLLPGLPPRRSCPRLRSRQVAVALAEPPALEALPAA